MLKRKSKTQIKLKSKEREGRFNPETHIRSNNKSGLASINYKPVLCEVKGCEGVQACRYASGVAGKRGA